MSIETRPVVLRIISRTTGTCPLAQGHERREQLLFTPSGEYYKLDGHHDQSHDYAQHCRSAAPVSVSMSVCIRVCVLNRPSTQVSLPTQVEVSRYPGTQQSISPLPQLFVGSNHRPMRHGALGPGQPALNACSTGVHPPRCGLRLRTSRGGCRGPELPILVRSPQPAVLAAAPALPQRETGSEKRKKIARRKLPNIGPLLHHHQPLSRRPALTHPLPPSVVFPPAQLSSSPPTFSGPLEQSNFPAARPRTFLPVLSSV